MGESITRWSNTNDFLCGEVVVVVVVVSSSRESDGLTYPVVQEVVDGSPNQFE